MIPARPGTYVLVLRCSTTRTVQIGRIGAVRLSPGWYLYVGSAFGPGGLRARIGHHARRAARPHWHVDYIRRYTSLEFVLYRCEVHCEHEWAKRIGIAPDADVVLRGFGSSDCACATHLFRFEPSPGSIIVVPDTQSGVG
jgi:Uri superfamily endonuclease